jgi:hypothetical protein
MYAVRRIAKAALFILIILFLTSESEYKNQIIEVINEPRYDDLEEEDGEDFIIEDHVKKNYKLIIPINEAVENIIAKEEMKKKLQRNHVVTL